MLKQRLHKATGKKKARQSGLFVKSIECYLERQADQICRTVGNVYICKRCSRRSNVRNAKRSGLRISIVKLCVQLLCQLADYSAGADVERTRHRRRQGHLNGAADTDTTAIRIFLQVIRSGSTANRRRPSQESGEAHMLPEQARFIGVGG